MGAIFDVISSAAPTLAGALGGKMAGNLVGMALDVAGKAFGLQDPAEITAAIASADPAKLAEIENAFVIRVQEIKLEELQAQLDAATAQIQAVNETMRAEAGAKNWPTWTWRPFLGFVFGIMAFGVYFVLPLAHVPPPVIPQEVWVAFMAILGVASWGHSKALADPANPAVVKG